MFRLSDLTIDILYVVACMNMVIYFLGGGYLVCNWLAQFSLVGNRSLGYVRTARVQMSVSCVCFFGGEMKI